MTYSPTPTRFLALLGLGLLAAGPARLGEARASATGHRAGQAISLHFTRISSI